MIAWNDLRERVNADPEFQHSARFWDATLRLDFDEWSQSLRFQDGRLVLAEPCTPDADCDLFIGASDESWRELLAPVPRPFYQDLFGAQLHHGVRLPAEQLDYAAYYPALRRLVQLLSGSREDA